MSIVSHRSAAASSAFDAVMEFYFKSRYAERREDAGISDFTFGNPHEMPLPGLVAAIREAALPQNKDWFAYKTSEEAPRTYLADTVGKEVGLPFEPADIALTAGAFAAISVAFHLVLDVGDEAIYSEPAWFCYEPMLLAADAVPRKVPLRKPRFDLDLDAIDAAIGPRTRLVIVNTPHNPTGRIYEDEVLSALADRLAEAFAERLHEVARIDWNFGRNENLSIAGMIDEKYRGIRPAPGYPACPDHTEKRTIFALLDVPANARITLTESCAMFPTASVSGTILAHPEAHYFAVGRLGRDQVADYARRKGMPLHEAERWLGPNLGYEREG